ncbi:hypothetical protein OMW55_00965 [Sphingomonas sp. BN140010]|uniref:Membrane-anchored protein n=1 Tax=Sphingomonas arvum TaxID=2992113 RepID=A0ABT3JBI3_9SPHN|nr:hypothetical protein [Sphingomonas sp. BN140010]MCW3796381.1 hypothetical protein [Sphingomonas sp. BN140010]
MDHQSPERLSKVPALTFGFWLVKILATTLGETAGDTVTMTWLGETTPEASEAAVSGYLVGTLIFGLPLLLLVAAQVRARGFHPALYWAAIIASTTFGTTLADFATRSLGIGYPGGSLLLLGLVLASLGAWRLALGRIASDDIESPRQELFYWVTITLSQTLGTALGDWVADSGPGYGGGALIFGMAIVAVAALWFTTRLSRAGLFWAAFILTRPLGATIGDFLDKPVASGGLEVSRPLASVILLVLIVLLLWLLPQRPGGHPARPERGRNE